MRNTNTVTLVGRLGSKPELKQTANGVAVVDFSIANNRDFGETKRVNWISCRAYKGLAETICKYLDAGSRIGVTGELTVDSWEDKESGNQRSRTYVLVTEMEFLSSKPSTEASSSSGDFDDVF